MKLAGLGGTNQISVNALQYTQAADSDKIDIITSTGKQFKIEKKFITVKF